MSAYPFKSTQQVRSEVATKLEKIVPPDATKYPKSYNRMVAKLEANIGKGNVRQIRELVPFVMNGLRDPNLYAEVLTEAWVRAMVAGTGINAALLQMASESGLTLKVIPGEMQGPAFFRRYAGRATAMLDKPLADTSHGSMIHILQDLVVDRALEEKGLSSGQFREMLGREKTLITLPSTDDTPRGEPREITIGDYVWRNTYDVIATGHIPTPESVWPILNKILGLK